MIVATAGHVDHGKTELVRALTGIGTDRLPEEKARGLSIDLGFAYQSLPDNTPLGFVDVPGHEKFIRNMLAGVGGIDLGLLVVAADDGVMPQTREHLAILDLLGIDHCVVAITKIDRVADDRILEVQGQVESLLGRAGREGVAIYPVCAPDNDGIDTLKTALHERARRLPEHEADGHFRMAIDRVFTLKGVGLVVTGMVLAGAAGVDDRLLLSADGSPARVRGIRAHDRASDTARAGERCAINIAGRGLGAASIRRGDWLLHAGLYAPTRRIDVDLRVLGSESRPLKHWTPTQLHLGAGRYAARVAVLDGGSIAAGERGLAQLVLERDAFVLHGDRFVLRDQSARRTMAGGHVIDPFSPKRGRSRPARLEMLRATNRRDPAEALRAAAAQSEAGVPLAPFVSARNLPPARLRSLIDSLSLRRVGDSAGERVFSQKRWDQLLDRIEAAVGNFHRARPTLPGTGLKDIQLALKPHVDASILETAAAALVDEKRLGRRGARWHLPAFEIPVSAHERELWARVLPCLTPSTGSPMSLQQAAEAIGVDKSTLEQSLKNAARIGEMVQIAKNRYLPASLVKNLGVAAEELAAKSVDACFTAAQYCEHIRTGRNFAIDLLEYFDRLGFTERRGNARRIRRPAAAVFAADSDSI